jgi:hypothetical protein
LSFQFHVRLSGFDLCMEARDHAMPEPFRN